MYPHKKENLIPYKEIFLGAVFCFVALFLVGIYAKKPFGFAFGLGFLLMAATGPGRALFRWHPEPTAKRQLVTAIILLIIIGMAGAVALDLSVAAYHLGRGECPVWLEFSGQCRLR